MAQNQKQIMQGLQNIVYVLSQFDAANLHNIFR